MNTVNIDKKEAEEGKVFAIFAYIIFLVPLLAARENKFVQFHANQGLVLFLAGVAFWILNVIISALFGFFLAYIVTLAGNLTILCLIIMGIINVISLEAKPLPFIGGITLIKSYEKI
ncbi:MAG: hypothetical protein ACOH15_06990 [Acetobacterium sp.]